MLTPHTPLFILLIALLGFLIGVAKGGLSGLGALLTPLLSLILPVSLAVGVMLPMLMVGDAFAMYTYWGEWDKRLVWRMLPAGAVGALLGTYLLTALSSNELRVALALFVLFIVAYKWLSDRVQRWQYRPAHWHAPVAGGVAGVASGLFNQGGPTVNAYLLLQKVPPRAFIANSVLFFTLLNLIKVPGFLYTGVLDIPRLLELWWVFPFIPVGIWVARWLITRINAVTFEWVIIALLIFSSGFLLWQSL